jgi:predicted O-methyltransferase YrrM
MSNFHATKKYLKFLIQSKTQYGIHSEFVYDLVIHALYKKKSPTLFKQWQQARKELLKDHRRIEISDKSAGSQAFSDDKRKISAVEKNAGISTKKARILQNIVLHRNPESILELGTSLGLGSLALSLPKKGQLTTVEACSNSLKVAKNLFEHYQIGSFVSTQNLDFDTYLDQLEKNVLFDLVIIDGNHTYEATWRYFNKISKHIHTQSLIILDDLYWSKEMTNAWEDICKSAQVSISIDSFDLGFLFFREGIEKQHFRIRV